MFTDIYLFIKSFALKIQRDRIYNYSASAAFFIILSIFPFLILLLTIVQYTPLTEEFLLDRLAYISPTVIYPILEQIITEIYTTTQSVPLILFSALGGIWSASKGIMSIIRGVNSAFNIDDRRNYFHVRLLSCLYTVIFIIVTIFVLMLLVFGSVIYNSLHENGSKLYTILKFITGQRILISLIVITLFLMTLYTVLPAKKNKFFQMFPGSILAAGALIGLSALASIYVKAFPNFSYTYGSLTSFILFMLVLYIAMYIIFLAGEVNFFFKMWIEKISAKHQNKKIARKSEKLDKKLSKKYGYDYSNAYNMDDKYVPDNLEETKIYSKKDFQDEQ